MDYSAAIDKLKLFNARVDKIAQYSFLAHVKSDSRVSMHTHPETGDTIIEKTGADDESTDAFAMNLRLLLQPRDKISFDEMEKLYKTLPLQEDEKRVVQESFQAYRQHMTHRGYVNFNGEVVTNGKVLETFLYGSLAHVNDDKAPQFEKWKARPMFPFLQFQFEHVLEDVYSFANVLAMLNRQILKRLEPIETGKE